MQSILGSCSSKKEVWNISVRIVPVLVAWIRDSI